MEEEAQLTADAKEGCHVVGTQTSNDGLCSAVIVLGLKAQSLGFASQQKELSLKGRLTRVKLTETDV